MTKTTKPKNTSPENTGKKQERRGRFKKGKSGNPAGRPRGARNQATLVAEQLFDGEAERITRRVIQMALDGDPMCLRLALERILPPRKERPAPFTLPKISTAQEATVALGAMLAAAATGDLTATEASDIAKSIEIYLKSLEAVDFDERLKKLETEGVR